MGCGAARAWDAAIVDKLLLLAPPPSYEEISFRKELLWIPLEHYGANAPAKKELRDDYGVPCRLFQCESARYLLLCFHRNGEDLGSCKQFCEKLRDTLGVHILVVEYPGYGLCTCAEPSLAQASRHAYAALDFLQRALGWPLDRTILFGYCVGAGFAMDLAAQCVVAGLVLVAPFLSVRKMLRSHVGPVARVFSEQMPVEELVPHVRSPTLVIHGQQDKMVPVAHSKQLVAALQCKKLLVSPGGVGHKTSLLKDEEHLLRPMANFFSLPGGPAVGMTVPQWAFQRSQPVPAPKSEGLGALPPQPQGAPAGQECQMSI